MVDSPILSYSSKGYYFRTLTQTLKLYYGMIDPIQSECSLTHLSNMKANENMPSKVSNCRPLMYS